MNEDPKFKDKKYSELSGISLTELRQALYEKRNALIEERVKHRLGKIEDSSVIGKLKREIARILTRLSAIRLGKEVESSSKE